MPILLSPEIIAEKNKLHGGSPFLLLLDIAVPGISESLRLVMNTEDIQWRDLLWQAIQFEIDEIQMGTDGEVPQVELRIANPNRIIEPYIDQYDSYIKKYGFSPITVRLIVVNSAHLENTSPVTEHIFELKTPQSNAQWVTFTLGASNPFDIRFPKDRLLKTHCRFRFRDARCAYKGGDKTCTHTLSDCRKKKNSERFGGYVGIGKSGVYMAEISA